MFEYDLFGFMQGAYTDAKEGKHGLLIENVGGVVFLDEIGEANDILQAKLLAFLDDYRVRPRKWEGSPFYCPVLVVAASNHDLRKMADRGKFRRDLLARFTDRHDIPSLKERAGDLPFILDCLLQRQSMNPNGAILEIGKNTLEHLNAHGFEEGNFRQLENEFRTACQLAMRDGRDYLAKSDFDQGRS
jgi:DNA-binding NtrC family response regulator